MKRRPKKRIRKSGQAFASKKIAAAYAETIAGKGPINIGGTRRMIWAW